MQIKLLTDLKHNMQSFEKGAVLLAEDIDLDAEQLKALIDAKAIELVEAAKLSFELGGKTELEKIQEEQIDELQAELDALKKATEGSVSAQQYAELQAELEAFKKAAIAEAGADKPAADLAAADIVGTTKSKKNPAADEEAK